MLRLAVSGCAGKMGQAILRLAAEDAARLKVTAVLDRSDSGFLEGPPSRINAALAADCRRQTDLQGLRQHVDVVIDFSRPEATLAYVSEAAAEGIALVIGTTGFDASQRQAIQDTAAKLPIVLAPNMSLGMNLVTAFAARLAEHLGEAFDVDIIETHHRHKQDIPSGSAKGLGEAVVRARRLEWRGTPPPEAGVRQRDGYPRFHSRRSGGVIGEHEVVFGSEQEVITISHTALNRDVFAAGALHAARWLHGKSAGLYTMRDVLGL